MAIRFDQIELSSSGHNYYPVISGVDSAQYLKIQTQHGYTQIGANNTSWSHFYTDRPNYYFNRGASFSGNIAAYGGTHTASFATYYDSNDTAYYVNPAGDSEMNQIRIDDYIRHRGDLDTFIGFPGNNVFRVETNGSTRLNIDSGGKVGINTTDADGQGYSYAEDLVILGGASASDGVGITLRGNGKRYGVIAFGDNSDDNPGEIYYDHNNDSMDFRTGTSVALRLQSGNVVQSFGDMRAPVFYDSNDTNYYVDPSDQSRMKYLNLGTSPTSGISSGYIAQFRGSLKMTNNNIDYVNQIHFNDNVRFYDDGNDSYLNFKFGDTSYGGIKMVDGDNNVHGYFYADGNDSIGILDNDANWAVQVDCDVLTALKVNDVYRLKANTSGVILGADTAASKTTVRGHLGIGDATYPKIAYPGQNALWSGSGSTTGQIVIDLPGTLANYDMMYMEIDIYEYSGDAATKLIVGGHNWNSGGNSNTSTTQWYNVNVQVLGRLTKPVYVGRRNDGSNERRCIAIGETNSSWSYATVHVAKVHGAEFYSTGIDWIADWNIAQTTSSSYFTKNPTTNFNDGGSQTFETNGIGEANHWFGSTSVRSPIFYDLDNTSFYINPQGTSVVTAIDANQLYVNDYLYHNGDTDTYMGFSSANQISFVAGGTTRLRVEGDVKVLGTTDLNIQGTSRRLQFTAGTGTVRTTTANNLILQANNTTRQTLSTGGYSEEAGSYRAPIFYDSNDTNYYANPAGASKLSALKLQPGSGNNVSGDDNVLWIHRENNNDWGIQINADQGTATDYGYEFLGGSSHTYAFSGVAAGTRYFQIGSSFGQHSGSFRAPIFYDSNDTNYYVNPASGSVLGGTVTIHNDSDSSVSIQNAGTNAVAIYAASGDELYLGSNNANVLRLVSGGDIEAVGHVLSKGKKQCTASISNSYVRVYAVSTDSSQLASVVKVTGTSHGNSHVGAFTAEIIVNHHQDVNITSSCGNYTDGVIKVESDSNGQYTMSYKSGSSNAATYYFTIEALSSEISITTNPTSTASTNTTHEHKLIFGTSMSAEGGSNPKLCFASNDGDTNVKMIRSGDGLQIKTGNSGQYTHEFHQGGTFYSKEFIDIDSTSHYLHPGATGDSLRVAGDVVAFYSSDERLKDNIKPIDNALSKVCSLSGNTFEWNEISHKETGKSDIGVIAQEVEEVFPEIVNTRDNGYKAVDYQKLSAVLIEAVKELKSEVEELKKQIK